MPISFLFPGGKKKALTLSYDDGVKQDFKLVEIMNKYGIRGTFHLNGGLFGSERTIRADEVSGLYQGHEVAAHGLTHQALTDCPGEKIISEIIEDRKALEKLTGKIVKGMSYPFGSVNNKVVETLKALGIEYSRMVQTTGDFHLPEDFMKWRGTCHHNERLMEHTNRFLNTKNLFQPWLFYIWGHSYEFDENNNWEMFEEFCKTAGGRGDIWYATNIEVCEYINAYKSLKFSADLKMVQNTTATDIFIEADGERIKIPAGTEMVI